MWHLAWDQAASSRRLWLPWLPVEGRRRRAGTRRRPASCWPASTATAAVASSCQDGNWTPPQHAGSTSFIADGNVSLTNSTSTSLF